MDADASRQLRVPVLTWTQFEIALDAADLRALGNSMIISILAVTVATLPSAIAAYSFSRHRIPGRQAILLSILFLSGVPISILIIPVYQLFQSLDWLSLVPTGVFLGVTAIPFEIYIIKNAMDAIPLDLEEAARIERAGTIKLCLRIVLPLSLPGIMAAVIYGFVTAWGNFLPPLVLIADNGQQPSPIAIFGFMTNTTVNYGAIAAYSIIYSTPVILLYVLAARSFRGGFILGGAVKA